MTNVPDPGTAPTTPDRPWELHRPPSWIRHPVRRWHARRGQNPPSLDNVWRIVRAMFASALMSLVGFGVLVWILHGGDVQDRKTERERTRHDAEVQAQQDVDTGYLGCLRYNDTRLLLRSIIEDAYLPNASPGGNADRAKAIVARIQDPAVRELVALQGSGGAGDPRTDPASTLNIQRNKTGTRPCEQEYPDHRPGLDLSTTVTIPPPPLQPLEEP